jgi:hypothetical protein
LPPPAVGSKAGSMGEDPYAKGIALNPEISNILAPVVVNILNINILLLPARGDDTYVGRETSKLGVSKGDTTEYDVI